MIRTVARTKWTPQTTEQRKAIAVALRARKHAEQVTEQADAKVWQAVADAIEQGVPASYMAETFNINRATLYRHVPGIAEQADRED